MACQMVARLGKARLGAFRLGCSSASVDATCLLVWTKIVLPTGTWTVIKR